MHLCLEHGRLYLTDVQNLLHLLRGKVGKANGAHLALFVGFLHQLVTGDIVSSGLVDEQQVNVVGSQTLERFFLPHLPAHKKLGHSLVSRKISSLGIPDFLIARPTAFSFT